MTEKNPMNDQQMETVLTQFFQAEMPAQLQTPPSQWAELKNPTSLTINRPTPQKKRSLGGTLAVAASLAACLLVGVIITQTSGDSSINTDGTMAVSAEGNANSETVDDDGVTLEEVDQIELNP